MIGLLLTFTAGCTVSIQPWTKSAVPPPTPPGPIPESALPFPNSAGLQTTSATRPPNTNPGLESLLQLNKQLTAVEEHRSALQEQVQDLKRQLKDKDGELRRASHDVEDSTKYVKRTREDFRQWQTEMDELRERIRKLEENRAALRPLIDEILHQLEREREPGKLPALPKLSK